MKSRCHFNDDHIIPFISFSITNLLWTRIKGCYWPQGLLSMPIDNIHKSWATPTDMKIGQLCQQIQLLTSSLVIPVQCNFSCSSEEWMKASSRRHKTETFGWGSTPLQKTGMFGVPEVSYHQNYSAKGWLSILRTHYPTQNLQRKHRWKWDRRSWQSKSDI
jgi:hypothetical protein